MNKTSEIIFKINLDENHIPEKITWQATDGGQSEADCKSIMLSVWDKKENNTLRVDLWTKELKVDEMQQHICQTILTLADTVKRAINDEESAEKIRDFGNNLMEDFQRKQ